MASVAADTSVIAPSPPLPTRSDATPPAGPAGAFSDLLDAAAAPATVPQPQGASGTRCDDGPSAAQASGSSATAASGATPAGAGTASSNRANGKAPDGSKSTDDQTADDSSADPANAAVNVTVVAGLVLPPFAFAPLPAADQTPAASQGTQTASSDSAAPTQNDTNGAPTDRKDTDTSSDSIPAGLAAAVPGLVTVVAGAPDSLAPIQSDPVGSVVPVTTLPGVISTALGTGAPAADADQATVAPLSAQAPNGTSQHNQGAASAALDLLTAAPFPTSAPPATDGLQSAALPPPSGAANNAAPDQNAQSSPAAAPIITSDVLSGTIKPAAAAASLNPAAPLISAAAENQVPAETVDNPSPLRDAVEIVLPPQVAVRFAPPAHSTDDATSDSGTDVLGGASIGATALAGSSVPPGAALAPSFTGILSTMQSAPGAPPAPQHAAAAMDAVPLAAVPIAIVTRAEAGERKFEIRLDPPDLGRIEVQLNVDSSGRATSHLVVDRADTLDLLRRDAPVLERALQSAGLTTDSGSLQFSLRDQAFAGRDQGTPAPVAPPTPATDGESDIAPRDAAVRRYGPAAGLGGGIDIRV